MSVFCPDCEAAMDLTDGKYGLYYKCRRFPLCKGRRGCNREGIPYDRPDDRETRQARIRAHDAFDAIWQDAHEIYDGTKPHRKARDPRYLRQLARGRCYAWLAHRLGTSVEDTHMSMFDRETCERVVDICQGMTYAEIRAWWKKNNPKEVVAK